MLFWALAALCAALIAALWWALSRLHALQLGRGAESGADAEDPPAEPDLERAKSRFDALLSLPEHGRVAAGEVTREAFGRAVIESARRTLGADRGLILLRTEPAGLKPLVAVGEGAETLAGRAWTDDSAPAKALASAKLERGAGGGDPDVCVPLLSAGKAIGVLCLFRASGGDAVDEADERFAAALAREAASALEQFERLEDQEAFSIEMLQVLARAAEAKDQALGNSERSRGLARRLAVGLGLAAGEVRHVEYAAMLHRVGKIGVDQALLSKPGKLSPKEYEQIKKYTTIGHGILSKARSLEPVARIVLHHQEWFNGKGYPDGLQGDAIPMGARIVAVVNAWEAMMQDRPYRAALSREAAVAELRKGAGSQFDPSVVEAFLKLEPETANK